MAVETLDLIFLFLVYFFRMACAVFVTFVIWKMLGLIQ